MRNLFVVAGFIALAIVGWGVFGPLLELGQFSMRYSALRGLLCVGSAFFLLAVGVPLFWLYSHEEEGGWTTRGVIWGLLAGVAAAVGTLGVVLAMSFGGNAVAVMPAVLGLIPIVHALVTMFTTGTFEHVSKFFYVAVIMVAVGAAGVLFFQPRPKNVDVSETKGGEITVTVKGPSGETTEWPAESFTQLESDPKLSHIYRLYQLKTLPTIGEFMMIVLGIVLAALCWGSYTTALRKSRLAMEGSRLRPLLVVGVAFLVLTVVLPIVLLGTSGEGGRWTFMGVVWSLLAGIAAAAGALGLVGALNCGGKTRYVLPVVFGGTLLVATLAAMLLDGTLDDGGVFYMALLLIVVGAAAAPIFTARPDDSDDSQASNKSDQKAKRESSRHEKEASKKETNKEEAPAE